MEILTAHQPTYLPWLGLFHKIAISDAFLFLDHVQYSKKQFYNRNTIKTANGPLTLSVPVFTSGQSFSTMIDEARIKNELSWKRDHWKAIELAYKKAPYFESYKDFFEKLYARDWEYLGDLDREILKHLLKVLGIHPQWIEGKDVNPQGEKSDLVLDMCIKVGCKNYIFGKMGEEYADKQKFLQHGIKIHFQDYKHPIYAQQFSKLGFLPYTSVIDLLFNEGEKSKAIILSGNVTREDILRSN